MSQPVSSLHEACHDFSSLLGGWQVIKWCVFSWLTDIRLIDVCDEVISESHEILDVSNIKKVTRFLDRLGFHFRLGLRLWLDHLFAEAVFDAET